MLVAERERVDDMRKGEDQAPLIGIEYQGLSKEKQELIDALLTLNKEELTSLLSLYLTSLQSQ